MPGIDCTSSSAVRRPPVLFEIVPPVATRRTRGTSCADATRARSAHTATAATTMLFRRRLHVVMKWIQVQVEEFSSDGGAHASRSYTGPAAIEARACARVSHLHNW